MYYEFRHVFPRHTASVKAFLESDRSALSFARLIENGAPVEVYAKDILVGRVEPNLREAADRNWF